MVLVDVSWIVIACWQKRLKVLLDVMANTQTIDQIEDAQSVVFPIGRFGHGQIVGPSDFVEVDEIVRMLDNCQATFGVQCWLQADPRKDATIVESLKRRDAVPRQLRPPLPFPTESVVQRRERAGKCIPVGAKNSDITQGSAATFGERADAHVVVLKNFEHWPCHAVVPRVVGVSCETEHDLFSNAALVIFACIFAQQFEKIRARGSSSVKFRAGHPQDVGNIAVGAGVPATTIRIGSELCVFTSLPTRGIDDAASRDAPAI